MVTHVQRLNFLRRLLFLAVGGLLSVFLALVPGWNLPPAAQATAGVATFTAWCWLTGPVPLEVASLMPALLLPATGVIGARHVAPLYFHDILLLFLGGFILALALERYDLHRRFALAALTFFGARQRRMILGFMLVAAGLSMFISNTSTALLMLPVAVAVLDECNEEEGERLKLPLLLGLAYAASIGGVASPIGTAPNGVLIARMAQDFPEAPEIAFGTWVVGALPFVLVFLVVAWWLMTRVLVALPNQPLDGYHQVRERRLAMGKRSLEQNLVLAVFCIVALLWMTRKGADFGSFSLPGWELLLPETVRESISDSTVALAGVMLLFILPGKAPGSKALMSWGDCIKVPWGILLLLGGGFALARAFEISGLATAIGESLKGTVASMPPIAAILVTSLVVTFLTEITSNTATINILLPLFFSASVAAGVHPLLLGLPATLAVSCAFMLPVATPPNAILFSSGRIRVREMARTGFWLNLCTVILVSLFAVYWVAPRWGFDLLSFPEWAR